MMPTFVGHGAGSFEREVVTAYTGSRVRWACVGGFALLAALVLVLLPCSWQPWASCPVPVTTAPPTVTPARETSTRAPVIPCVTSLPTNSRQEEYCCQQGYRKWCPTTTAAPKHPCTFCFRMGCCFGHRMIDPNVRLTREQCRREDDNDFHGLGLEGWCCQNFDVMCDAAPQRPQQPGCEAAITVVSPAGLEHTMSCGRAVQFLASNAHLWKRDACVQALSQVQQYPQCANCRPKVQLAPEGPSKNHEDGLACRLPRTIDFGEEGHVWPKSAWQSDREARPCEAPRQPATPRQKQYCCQQGYKQFCEAPTAAPKHPCTFCFRMGCCFGHRMADPSVRLTREQCRREDDNEFHGLGLEGWCCQNFDVMCDAAPQRPQQPGCEAAVTVVSPAGRRHTMPCGRAIQFLASNAHLWKQDACALARSQVQQYQGCANCSPKVQLAPEGPSKSYEDGLACRLPRTVDFGLKEHVWPKSAWQSDKEAAGARYLL